MIVLQRGEDLDPRRALGLDLRIRAVADRDPGRDRVRILVLGRDHLCAMRTLPVMRMEKVAEIWNRRESDDGPGLGLRARKSDDAATHHGLRGVRYVSK